LNKALLQRKIEEFSQVGIELALDFEPSLIQLHMEKNVFEVVDRVPNGNDKTHNSTMPYEPPQNLPNDFKEEETLAFINPNEVIVAEGPPVLIPFDDDDDACFGLGIVDASDSDKEEISDDSDYGSPR